MTHIAGRDSLTVLTVYAAATERIRPRHRRRADLHAHAGDDGPDGGDDRTSSPAGACAWASASRTGRSSRAGTGRRSTSPWPRCASTSPIVRAILRGEAPPAGREVEDELRAQRHRPVPDLPIYVAALSPAMLRAGRRGRRRRRCCGCATRDYIRDVVVPEVATGASARARRSRASTSSPPSRRPCVDDPAARSTRCAATCSPTSALPFYRAMLERSGFERRHRRLRRGGRARRRRGDAGGDLRRASSRASRRSATRTPSRAGVARYADAGADVALRRARSRRRTSRRRCARRRPG